MDSVSDKEIGEIWDRMKKDVDVTKLKQTKNQQTFIESLKQEMESIPNNKKQVRTLINKGFVERVSELSETRKFIEVKPKAFKPPIKKPIPVEKLPARLAKRKANNKISIKKQGRFRSFNLNNIKITNYSWRGKPAVSFYSLKQKKLITWGLNNE